MKKKIDQLFELTRVLEIIICIAILIAIGISMLTLAIGLKEFMYNHMNGDAFQKFLAIAFNVLIAIEFLKMIYKYSVDTVIEVLLFANARQLIVEHTSVVENLIGVISIAVLFAIRKYMFVPALDKENSDKIYNEQIKNEQIKNEQIKYEQIKNEQIKNEQIENDQIEMIK